MNNSEIEDKLWRTCAGGYLADFPDSFTRKRAITLMDGEPVASRGITIWEPLDGRPLYGVLQMIECQYQATLRALEGYELVTPEWKDSAERLAHYVNYNGDEDDDYGEWLEEGHAREDHIAYHAAVVGEWDDLVWEQFQRDKANEQEIEGAEEEEPAEPAGTDSGAERELGGIRAGVQSTDSDHPGEGDSLLGKFVTAKLLGEEDCRQGWVIQLDPLLIEGASGTVYECEGTPTEVSNPPPRPTNMKKGFTLLELIVVLIIVSALACLAVIGVLLVKGCNHVSDKGLKPTMESVWEGKKVEQPAK